MTILGIVAPVFLLIAIGWGLLRWRFFTADALNDVNRLCYWVALPAVLFQSIATSEPDFRAAADLFVVILGATLLGIVAATLWAVITGMSVRPRGAYIQGAFRGNLVFVGLPVVIYAFAASPPSTPGAADAALLITAPMIALYNVFGVFILLISAGGLNKTIVRQALFGLASNPLLLGSAAGLLFAASGATLPGMLDRTLHSVGQMAFPLALICIGGALFLTRLQGNLQLAFSASLIKVGLLPLFGAVLAWLIGLSADHTLIALIMLASPTAAASYVLTKQLRGDEGLASSVIFISHVAVIPSLLVILALLID